MEKRKVGKYIAIGTGITGISLVTYKLLKNYLIQKKENAKNEETEEKERRYVLLSRKK